jgi:hypothetical protein
MTVEIDGLGRDSEFVASLAARAAVLEQFS